MNLARRRTLSVVLLGFLAMVAVATACNEASRLPTATPGDAVVPPGETTPTSVPASTPIPEPTPTDAPATPGTTLSPEAAEEPREVERVAAELVGGKVGSLAPELEGISGWLQAEPFTLKELRGGVVLIDFWTYTCVNCIRTLPYLKAWHERYADMGLTIVGVHAPEFEFEKVRKNVEMAIAEHGLEYPVVLDNDFGTWRAFDNHSWPSKYLIDKDGIVRYTHSGEGAYDETERQIRDLLWEAGADLSDIVAGAEPGLLPDPKAYRSDGTGQTRELYAGYIRNFSPQGAYIANPEYYYAPVDGASNYVSPKVYRNHFLYLNGVWVKGPESVTHARETQSMEDYLVLRFHGTSVNVVTDFDDGEPFPVYVTLNSEPLPDDGRGSDIIVDADGNTFFEIDEARMYNLVRLPEYGGHDLKLITDSDRFSVFAFTFGSYAYGP